MEALRAGEMPVGDIVARVRIQQSGVSRHLGILQQAGFVAVRPEGQKRYYALQPEPFREIDAWLSHYRSFWEARLDKLGEAIEKKRQKKVALKIGRGPKGHE